MKNERPFSGIGGSYRALHLIAIISAIFATVEAQSAGSISGRVITGDGKGVSQVNVWIYPAGSGARRVAPGSTSIVATDEEGRFRFTDLPPAPYRIDVREAREYAVQSTSGREGRRPRYFYAGDQVTITMVKGGAITGRVTTPEGEPMVRAQVSPIMVRDAEGNPVRQSIPTGWTLADDRGIYRLFGLAPGTYLVFTNGCSFYSPMPHTQQLQIYHPSSTRETATEVTVTSGGEVSGADIRFRNDLGRMVSGTITGGDAPPSSSATSGLVSTNGNTFLTNIATGVSLSEQTRRTGDGGNGFAFYGVGDGEYQLVTYGDGRNRGVALASEPRRVRVKGADVIGIEMKLTPSASISGKVVLEPSPGLCRNRTAVRSEELLVSVRRARAASGSDRSIGRWFLRSVLRMGGKSSPPRSIQWMSDGYSLDDDGRFTISYLTAGRYGLGSVLPDENWYLKSVTAPAPTGSALVSAGAGLSLKSGEQITGVTMVVAEGAARLRGRIVAGKEGSRLPSRLRIHLVPRETTAADEPLRYAETQARSDRTFEFNNLAPGRYWLTVRAVPESKSTAFPAWPVAWDRAERTKLRKEAESGKIEIELAPCQRFVDQVLKFR